MKTGTKSLLFGCHQIILHPIFVLIAWLKLYEKFPPWRVLLAIIIHDWGLWGCENIDDEEGERHPRWAAKVMDRLFGSKQSTIFQLPGEKPWTMGMLVMYHSRFLARKENCGVVSPLCLPDKLGVALMPTWLWVGLGRLTGEVWEYVNAKKYEEYQQVATPREKFERYKELCARWVSGEAPLCPWIEEE